MVVVASNPFLDTTQLVDEVIEVVQPYADRHEVQCVKVPGAGVAAMKPADLIAHVRKLRETLRLYAVHLTVRTSGPRDPVKARRLYILINRINSLIVHTLESNPREASRFVDEMLADGFSSV